MSEAKFTKGKWSPYIGDCDTQEVKCDGKTVISWQGFDGLIIDESEKIANTYLMASAPDMYKEIESEISILEGQLIDAKTHGEASRLQDRIIRKVKLLAKARGEHD